MEGYADSSAIRAALVSAPRRYPKTPSDPMNLAHVFGDTASDAAIAAYLQLLRKYIMTRVKREESRSALAELETIKAKPSARAEVLKPRAEVLSSKRNDRGVIALAPKNNRALREAQRDRRPPSSIEWAAWRDDNPGYIKKSTSRKREREVADPAGGDVEEPLSTRQAPHEGGAQIASEEYTSASSQYLSSSEEEE